MLDEKAMKFLQDRGIDPEIPVRLGFETAENGHLAMPYYRGGSVVNRKFRDLDHKRFYQDTAGQKCFWNIDVLADCDGNTVIITEGELDGVVALQCGFTYVISVPDGAPNESLGPEYDGAKYSYLDDGALAQLQKASCVVLATDCDQNGDNLAHDLSLRIGRERCKRAIYPRRRRDTADRCKDLNETLTAYGPDAVVQSIDKATWWAYPSVRRLSEIPVVPILPVYKAGVVGFDDLYRFRMGDLGVWTGIPGHGKTAFVDHAILSLVNQHDFRACFASLEMHPRKHHEPNIRKWFLDGRDDSDHERFEFEAWVDRHLRFVNAAEDEESATLSLDWIIECMKAAAFRHGCCVFVIDPWNELEHERPREMSLTEYINYAVKELRRQAAILSMHLIIVAHPHKLQGDAVPGLYSISDSAAWANKPALGVVVHRPKPGENNTTIFSVKKCKFEEIGRLGKAPFLFSSATRRFTFDEVLDRA